MASSVRTAQSAPRPRKQPSGTMSTDASRPLPSRYRSLPPTLTPPGTGPDYANLRPEAYLRKAPQTRNTISVVPTRMTSPTSSLRRATFSPLTYTPLVEPRSASSYPLSTRLMPTCLRDTPVSVSSTVLPATEPMVVTSRSRLIDCPRSGPDTNSSSARISRAVVPQKRHLTQSAIMTRPQLRQGSSLG